MGQTSNEKKSENGQKQIFSRFNPLEKRLGKSFFDQLPQKTGIYKMYSASGELLYVGKAKNLRKRLFQYRRSGRKNRGRKSRMIYLIDHIEIEVFDHEREALLRENELLRTLKPTYNMAKTSPESYYYVGFRTDADAFTFDLTMHYIPDRYHSIFGAFKGHRLVRSGVGALLRQLWIYHNERPSAFHFPGVLTQNLTANHFELDCGDSGNSGEALKQHIERYLEGSDMELIRLLGREARERELLDGFLGKMILRDLESMKNFYNKCSRRNYLMYKTLDLADPRIMQNQLDDCLVRYSFEKGAK